MYLIDQHTKKIMEECKKRAWDAGLKFDDETLEYIVTNKDMLELSPKVMIPTLYDYWANDVEVLKKKGQYKLYPSNPYETVINSRPAISFYNDNNPDWLNIMIFYHVIGHIDFFQNNILYKNTWNDDFVGQALADKRLIEDFRSRHGRWVDYVIEFSRSIDNIVSYFDELNSTNYTGEIDPSARITYYFDVFLQEEVKVPFHEVYKEIERYNQLIEKNREIGESIFFSDIKVKYPEFDTKFSKYRAIKSTDRIDLLEFIRDNSLFLKKDENRWMKSIMSVIRNTSLYFSPQIRTKIMNEGWASYWHDKLFRSDDRIKGHETSYAKINAWVTSLSRVGLNPYAIGLRLMQYIEELGDKGKINYDYQKIRDIEIRKDYDMKTGKGMDTIFEIRKEFSDFTFINTFIDQDFVDRHSLFVTGKRLDQQRGVYQYYVKSKKAEDYKKMLIDSLYHPPYITADREKSTEECLYLKHSFEGKQLIQDFIRDVLIGIGFLWGGDVKLETTLIIKKKTGEIEHQRVIYYLVEKKLKKEKL